MACSPSESTPLLSIRNGIRCVPDASIAIEEVLTAIAGKVGPEKIGSASRMSKAVVVFFKKESVAYEVIESGLWVRDTFLPVTPLSAPATKVTISNVLPFIGDDEIKRELTRFGKFASSMTMIPLGCKNPALKHVFSFRRQVFMFLNESAKGCLDVSFPCGTRGEYIYGFCHYGES